MAPTLDYLTPLKWLTLNNLVAIPVVIAAEAASLFLVDDFVIGSKFASLALAGTILGTALFAVRTILLATQSDQKTSNTGHHVPA